MTDKPFKHCPPPTNSQTPFPFLSLSRKGVNACGTVRPNWKYFPQDLVVNKRDVDTGYYDYCSSSPLLATVCLDKHIIHMLSTMHVAYPSSAPATVWRRVGDGTEEDVMYPPCLPDYQAYMRGVDRGDQLVW